MKAQHADLLDTIRSTKALPDTDKLDSVLRSFVDGFAVTVK
jgi:hypothetical protein